jgi:hypothetical protein
MTTYSECLEMIADKYYFKNWKELKESENSQNMEGFYEEVAFLFARSSIEMFKGKIKDLKIDLK